MTENRHNSVVAAEVTEREQRLAHLQRGSRILTALAADASTGHLMPDELPMSVRGILGGEGDIGRALHESADAVHEAAEQQRVSVAAARELKVGLSPKGAELPRPTAEENFG